MSPSSRINIPPRGWRCSLVWIRAFGKEANYLRDLPLHASQRELAQGDGYADFEMTLRPTEDFYTPLLARGAAIKVLEPQALADAIKARHQAASELYQ
ncbi:MAG: WYL domain-containing protein [Bacteroidales bacterium]|nr:WYL domain-containing protein [Bacteroidales bacterium]